MAVMKANPITQAPGPLRSARTAPEQREIRPADMLPAPPGGYWDIDHIKPQEIKPWP